MKRKANKRGGLPPEWKVALDILRCGYTVSNIGLALVDSTSRKKVNAEVQALLGCISQLLTELEERVHEWITLPVKSTEETRRIRLLLTIETLVVLVGIVDDIAKSQKT